MKFSTILLTLCSLFILVTAVNAQNYVGDNMCKACHGAGDPTGAGYNIAGEYVKTGHPYKLNKIEGGHPTYPENTTPGVVLPAGKTWADFDYVIGGYGWKARFIDHNGKIFTGDAASDSLAQYNLEDGSWVTYHKGEDKAYNFGCFQCHSTGPSEEGTWNANTEGLGTFAEAGIRCEGCHGPGGDHITNPSGNALPNQGDFLKLERCGECHQRGGATNAIPASGGYIKHHEQINEMRASKHGDGVGGELTCASCHDSHIALRYPEVAGEGLSGIKTVCQTCHPSQQVLIDGVAKNIDCVDCHMPAASKSAVGMQTGNGWRGDVKTHIMAINTSAVTRESMFNSAGDAVELDGNGLAAVTLDFACLQCHTNQDVSWAASYADGIHDGISGVETDINLPSEFALNQNYPNPFNPTTTITFSVPKATRVDLLVYSPTGELVAKLINNQMPAGNHMVEFDASELASGVYVYKMIAGNFIESSKMLLLK